MPTLTEETRQFIRKHRTDDIRSLALQASRHPSVDIPTALTQIAGWQIARTKIPSWAEKDELLYPVHLSMEQCSSETTARHKASLLKNTDTSTKSFCDLTGGFGIDCAFLSQTFKEAHYVEQQETLCQLASHNFPLLGLSHIQVHHADSVTYLNNMTPVDWIFIDPARRDTHGGKTIAISDCEPDVASLEELLLQKAEYVLIKLSPMLDLTLAIQTLKHVIEAHVVSVGNECKELLLLLNKKNQVTPDKTPIHCVNLTSKETQFLCFNRSEEQTAECRYTNSLKQYLYEPNASILKAGAYRQIAHTYHLEKLHPNSHLYTSGTYLPHFPGRIFTIEAHTGFGKKELKTILKDTTKANLSIRNFPTSIAELRKRLKLAEGGDTYLFATTLADESKTLIKCKRTVQNTAI